MKRHTWIYISLGVVVLGLSVVIILARNVLATQADQTAKIIPTFTPDYEQTAIAAVEDPFAVKPVNGWVVCQDLGIGPIPGVPGARQRFVLCHPSGWQVRVYCLDTSKPPPPLGHSCTRVSSDTYWCGNVYQPLREYQILVTPTHTPTPTLTPTPTSTPTFTPTSTPTPTVPVKPTSRVRPGGEGNSWAVNWIVVGAVFVLSYATLGFLTLVRRRKNNSAGR
jgi:hypothetical protein